MTSQDSETAESPENAITSGDGIAQKPLVRDAASSALNGASQSAMTTKVLKGLQYIALKVSLPRSTVVAAVTRHAVKVSDAATVDLVVCSSLFRILGGG
jgi:hypothetical protein